jgi:hypothetical protein
VGRGWEEKERKSIYFSEVNATKNTCSVNRIRPRLWGRKGKKRREKFLQGQRDCLSICSVEKSGGQHDHEYLAVWTVSGGGCGEEKERKGAKVSPRSTRPWTPAVWTVSGGVCGEEKEKERRRVYHFFKVNATMNTYIENCVRRRLWGKKKKK